MIAKSLLILSNQLNQYMKIDDEVDPTSPDVVLLGNIALVENNPNNTNGTANNVLLSLVNIEEEKRLKNARNYSQNGNQIEYANPPINLNLYLLFSASYNDYETALRRLSQVIEFFQGKKSFTYANSPSPGILSTDPDIADLKMLMEIHTLNFEQINDLWGSLGGKQVPFVMYRARLFSLRSNRILSTGAEINEINGKFN